MLTPLLRKSNAPLRSRLRLVETRRIPRRVPIANPSAPPYLHGFGPLEEHVPRRPSRVRDSSLVLLIASCEAPPTAVFLNRSNPRNPYYRAGFPFHNRTEMGNHGYGSPQTHTKCPLGDVRCPLGDVPQTPLIPIRARAFWGTPAVQQAFNAAHLAVRCRLLLSRKRPSSVVHRSRCPVD